MQSVGGIFLPDSSKSKLPEGTVIAVGPGKLNADGKVVAPSVKAGDTVLLPEYGGAPIKLDEDNEYALFRDEDILAVLKA
jgi:co-chaperonin GroES (HSP10)